MKDKSWLDMTEEEIYNEWKKSFGISFIDNKPQCRNIGRLIIMGETMRILLMPDGNLNVAVTKSLHDKMIILKDIPGFAYIPTKERNKDEKSNS